MNRDATNAVRFLLAILAAACVVSLIVRML